MNSDFYITIFSILVPIWFGIFALFFIVIGLRGILTKRPFLISNRWLLSVMFIGLVPAILILIFLQGSDSPFIMRWLNPVNNPYLKAGACAKRIPTVHSTS